MRTVCVSVLRANPDAGRVPVGGRSGAGMSECVYVSRSVS